MSIDEIEVGDRVTLTSVGDFGVVMRVGTVINKGNTLVTVKFDDGGTGLFLPTAFQKNESVGS